MSKIAIDVVVLPSEEMIEKAIEANRLLAGKEIVLGKETCLPHISLAMGCMEEADISKIETTLREIAEQSDLGKLRVSGVFIGINSVGRKVSSFVIERSESLRIIHEAVMRELKPYLTYGVTAEMVLSPPISQSTLRWIRDYPEKAAFEHFFPHITIGYGHIGDIPFPREFDVSNLALFHLGNHCTCRKVLLSLPL